jgi:hypothetical protein
VPDVGAAAELRPTVPVGTAVPGVRPRDRMGRSARYSESEPGRYRSCKDYATDWCTVTDVIAGDSGAVVLRYAVCRSSLTDGVLQFPTKREADFAVLAEDGTVLWRWSTGQVFAASPSVLSVPDLSCYTWQTTWDRVLDGGRRLAAGTYWIESATASTAVGSPPATRTTATLD